uniref:Uncharacterized protein n=1 Tax=Anguilla anguilla TaxID=7936 RepID=A0A0E9WFN6_ANGAN
MVTMGAVTLLITVQCEYIFLNTFRTGLCV